MGGEQCCSSPRSRVNRLIERVDTFVDQACWVESGLVSFVESLAEEGRRRRRRRKKNNGEEKRKNIASRPPTKTIRRRHQLLQRTGHLPVIPARKDAHDTRHRPGEPGTVVGPTDSVDDGAAHEIRVGVGTEQECAGGLVDGVVLGEVADEGRGEEGGDVGVVHDVASAVAVDFVGVDGAVDGVGDDSVPGDCGGEGGG